MCFHHDLRFRNFLFNREPSLSAHGSSGSLLAAPGPWLNLEFHFLIIDLMLSVAALRMSPSSGEVPNFHCNRACFIHMRNIEFRCSGPSKRLSTCLLPHLSIQRRTCPCREIGREPNSSLNCRGSVWRNSSICRLTSAISTWSLIRLPSSPDVRLLLLPRTALEPTRQPVSGGLTCAGDCEATFK